MNALDDLRYALRQIRRQPGFALVIVLTLGGAMGVSTTLFSVENSIWFQPWPVRDPPSVVLVRPYVPVSEWQQWAEQSKSFDGLAARNFGSFRHLRGQRVAVEPVSANYFEVLGIPIVRGQGFTRADDTPAGDGTKAIVSHRTWQMHFGADPSIIGRSIQVDDISFIVVGVAAPGFDGAGERLRRHVWIPLAAWPRIQPKNVKREARQTVQAVGRLQPGSPAPLAQAELATLSRRFRTERGLAIDAIEVRSTDNYSQSPPSAQAQATFLALLLAVTFLTLVACANVANLLLARGYSRRGEIAVRLSLGASRVQLVRRQMVEALVLSLAAGLLGIAVSVVLPGHLFAVVPRMAEMLQLDFRPDHHVFAWSLFASALACLAFGLVPALQCTRMSVCHVLKDAHGQFTPSLKTSLPSMQALVSVAALGVAGLVLRSEPYARARVAARAFESIAVLRPDFPQDYDGARRRSLVAGLLDGLETSTGPNAVAACSSDRILGEQDETRSLGVTPSYFEVLHLPLAGGRTFLPDEAMTRVMVVNEAFAHRYWPSESPIGKALASSPDAAVNGREVVGVVRDEGKDPVAYLPAPVEQMNIVFVRDTEPRAKAHVATLLASLDPSLRTEVVSGSAWIAQSMPGQALALRAVGEFGAFTLVLATMGFFSLSDYGVRQRTREIGIRTALGAQARHVLAAVFWPAARALLNGLLFGTFAAVCVGFVMRRAKLPDGVNPLDLANYAGVAVVLLAAGLAAAFGPARHAMRITPNEALRYE